jgi:hypothetical protein
MTKSESRREDDDAFWLDGETSVIHEEPETTTVYDLEERTARFGEMVVDFARTIPLDPVTDRIISQLIGAGTSVGAIISRPTIPFPKKNFSSALIPARRKRVKRSIFCAWQCAQFQN